MGTHPIFESDFDCLTASRMLRRGSLVLSSRAASRKALVLPIVEETSCPIFAKLDSNSSSKLSDQINAYGGFPKAGEVRNLVGSFDGYSIISVVGKSAKLAASENRDENAENMRHAVANAVKSLKGLNFDQVDVASPDNLAQSAAEAAKMTTWSYKESAREKMPQNFSPYSPDQAADWIKEQNMNAFWSVAKGSSEEPKFVEMIWDGENKKSEKTFCLVGKGVTFDSGGISIKPSAKMGDMRGDMGGAAVTFGAMYAAAKLKIPGKVIALTPLAENMPAGNASKPGDVVVARNGKTIQIDNTDAEGRLLLCDTLDYAAEIHKPTAMIDSATLTGAMVIALGSGATGVFCKNNTLWSIIEKSGYETGDRAWRMPHYKHYFDSISPTHNADLNNTGGREAGSATAAGFLSAFVPEDIPWAHFDIAGVMDTSGATSPYICKGMSGRPTRTLYQILENFHQ